MLARLLKVEGDAAAENAEQRGTPESVEDAVENDFCVDLISDDVDYGARYGAILGFVRNPNASGR